MNAVLVVVLAVVTLAVLFVAALALRARRGYAEANEVVPGVPTRAPAAWAGAHTPEARLHRRLRDAVAAFRQIPRHDGGDLVALGAAVERAALEADERLVAVAALPGPARTEALTRVTRAVEAIEQAVVAAAVERPADGAAADALREATDRLRWLAEARAQLEALGPTWSTEAVPPAPAGPPAEPASRPEGEQRPGEGGG